MVSHWKGVLKAREKRKKRTADRSLGHQQSPPLMAPGLCYGRICDKGYGHYFQQIPLGQAHNRESKKEKCSKGAISLIKDGVWGQNQTNGGKRHGFSSSTPRKPGDVGHDFTFRCPIKTPGTSCTAVQAVDCTSPQKTK